MEETAPQVQQTQSPQESPTGRSRMISLIIGLTVLVLFLTYAAVLAQNRQQPPQVAPTVTPTPTPVDETVYTESTRSANWKTYTNTTWKYQFQYPSTWIVEELDMEHEVITSPDIEKSADGRIVKFPTDYIKVNIISRKNMNSSFEEELKSTYTETPQCTVGSECPSSPPQITKKVNSNSLEYYFLTTGVYYNELAIFPLLRDKKLYVEFDTRVGLRPNGKLPEQILSTFKFLDQEQTTDWQSPLDVVRCSVGEKRSLSHGLGSKNIQVEGLKKNTCILTYTDEIEGGYTTYECLIPVTLREIFPSNLDVAKFCKQTKSGNVFLENKY